MHQIELIKNFISYFGQNHFLKNYLLIWNSWGRNSFCLSSHVNYWEYDKNNMWFDKRRYTHYTRDQTWHYIAMMVTKFNLGYGNLFPPFYFWQKILILIRGGGTGEASEALAFTTEKFLASWIYERGNFSCFTRKKLVPPPLIIII